MEKKKRRRIRLSSFQIIILGFLAVIFAGAALLMLPAAVEGTERASFSDALFTSVSAVCVTGLIVQDTATYFSAFGETVILTLIQIGGLGVVTVGAAVFLASGRKISLAQRSVMQDAISAHHIGGIVRLTGFILKTVILMEAAGAILLSIPFVREFGWGKGIWYGIFHSVSAFCNAGFDLMGIKGQYGSLTAYCNHPLVNAVIMMLIISGGLGFLTWEDVTTHGFKMRRYRLQSKIILSTTLLLILVPAVCYYLIEFSTDTWKGMNGGERALAALFQAVTPRTAGFNTVDLTQMSEGSIVLMIMLMLIGGSPGSTAGGMKTTTVAVMFFMMISVFRRQDSAHCFKRRIDAETGIGALAILCMYLILFLVSGISISWIENLPVLDCLFETASAVGTVGLSLGLTPSLSAPSRVILMALMFFGRVGGLTLIYAASFERKTYAAMLPKEKVIVG